MNQAFAYRQESGMSTKTARVVETVGWLLAVAGLLLVLQFAYKRRHDTHERRINVQVFSSGTSAPARF